MKVRNGAERGNDGNRAEADIQVDVTMCDLSRLLIRYAHGPLAARSGRRNIESVCPHEETKPMNDFEQFSYCHICAALANIDTSTIPDIYALSFFIYDNDDDPRYPVLQLGYNTLTHLTECTPSASDAAEAKWNFAFWLQNELKYIGEPDTEGGQLLEELLKARGLWYTDEDEEADFDRCMRIGGDINAYFVDACVRIARALHENGVIEKGFSRPIPIVVHELEYYDEIAVQTRLANPPDLAKEFEDWIASM
ncbi:hypothetical protein IGS59_00885 [Janthinobacterium sp. GW460P]|uniref:hypothetical protein n=1 Tax=unclassified Janthinobacterium TaxID=2610881 RepID=UPI00111C3CFE|nr:MULTISPECIES: hypothetical protein [unclassified Janthinobacterium]MCC7700776.1 hypothetical protein [Janthinobacterium sp. GW460P]MCC7706283.1 hypothetical protein [Janthinobacterium sp. GW460W]